MSAIRQVDDLIIGGGAAGLSLACALARGPRSRQVLVVESRAEYSRDRTWCYWDVTTGEFDQLASHHWHQWRVGVDSASHLCRSHRYAYRHIRADHFYQWAIEQLASAPHCQLQLDTCIETLRDSAAGVDVITSRGPVRARRVFDSRPRPETGTANEHIDLKQHFLGWHVRIPAPLFEPNTVTLMDFKRRDDGQIQFFYLLPFSRNEALVEATFISTTLMDKACYQAEIAAYLRQLGADSNYDVLFSEQGCLPMSTRPMPQRYSPHVYAIGSAAGLLKPSTGYAFLAIQRHTLALANAMANTPHPRPPAPRAHRLTVLDRIFLAVLARHPDRAPDLFIALFEQVAPDRLVRFLSDVPQPADILAVIGAMPKGLFTREAIACAPLWLRNE